MTRELSEVDDTSDYLYVTRNWAKGIIALKGEPMDGIFVPSDDGTWSGKLELGNWSGDRFNSKVSTVGFTRRFRFLFEIRDDMIVSSIYRASDVVGHFVSFEIVSECNEELNEF